VFEIRLLYACAHIDRWAVFNEPHPDDVEMRCEYACSDCQRKAAPRAEALEMMAEAALAMRRLRPRGRKLNEIG
jgi:hypothetical protein